MNFQRFTIVLSVLIALCMTPTPACFANKKAYIPSFTSPVQNYAVIDISGAAVTDPVTLVALDDANDVAFAFPTGKVEKEYLSNGPEQYHVYTWSSGILGTENIVDCYEPKEFPSDFSDYYHITIASYNFDHLLATGWLYGTQDQWYVVFQNSYHRIAYAQSGHPSVTDAPSPPLELMGAYHYLNTGLFETSVSESGVITGSWAAIPLGKRYDEQSGGYFILNKDDDTGKDVYTIFDQHPNYDTTTIPDNVVIVQKGFYPGAANKKGWAIGGNLDDEKSAVWDGQNLNPLDSGNAVGLNEQCQVIVKGQDEQTTNTEGYLWENQVTTTLRHTLPYYFQFQDWDIQPSFISNQVKASDDDGSISSDTDQTIHILADAKSFDIDPDGKAILTRDNSNQWHYAHVQLPPNTTVTNWTTINSSGVIAAIGNAGTGDGHALLLFPLDVVEDSSEDANSNSFATNAISPTPNAITGSNGKILSKLAVAKMNGGTISGNGASATLNIDNDADNFCVRIYGAAGSGISSVKVASVDNPHTEYNDGPVMLDLHADGRDLVSKSLLLTADDVDDQVKVDNIADNAENDRTYKIQLGGNFEIASYQKDNKDHPITEKVPVSTKNTVHCTPIIVRSFAGKPPDNTAEGVEYQLIVARERLAQVGIQLIWSPVTTVDPPIGTKIYNGLSILDVVPPPGILGAAVLSTDAKSVIANNGGCNNGKDIHVFWINSISLGTNAYSEIGGLAVAPYYFDPGESRYCNNCFIESGDGPFVAAHELGHILTNAAHVEDPLNLMWGHDQSMTNTLTSHKRLNSDQSTAMQGSFDAN